MNAERFVELLDHLIDAKLARQTVSGPNVQLQLGRNDQRVEEIKAELLREIKHAIHARSSLKN